MDHYDLEPVRTKLFEGAEWHSHTAHKKATDRFKFKLDSHKTLTAF